MIVIVNNNSIINNSNNNNNNNNNNSNNNNNNINSYDDDSNNNKNIRVSTCLNLLPISAQLAQIRDIDSGGGSSDSVTGTAPSAG